jgi:hypothetical protein
MPVVLGTFALSPLPVNRLTVAAHYNARHPVRLYQLTRF